MKRIIIIVMIGLMGVVFIEAINYIHAQTAAQFKQELQKAER